MSQNIVGEKLNLISQLPITVSDFIKLFYMPQI